jgi:hypothetical protein
MVYYIAIDMAYYMAWLRLLYKPSDVKSYAYDILEL